MTSIAKIIIILFLSATSAYSATLYCGPSSTGAGSGANFSNLVQRRGGDERVDAVDTPHEQNRLQVILIGK